MKMTLNTLAHWLKKISGEFDYWALRYVERDDEVLKVENDKVIAPDRFIDRGWMLTVVKGPGYGYAASSDISERGLQHLIEAANQWACISAECSIFDYSQVLFPSTSGQFESKVTDSVNNYDLSAKLDLLMTTNKDLNVSSQIIHRKTALWTTRERVMLINSEGAQIEQTFHLMNPQAIAVAHNGEETQIRSFWGGACYRQGGWEIFDDISFKDSIQSIGEQACQLLDAEPCPQMQCPVVIAADQMILQIHESIGHPIELDRVLGDERNYAGTSFVTLDMFGQYQYGSELLNVSFDPTVEGQCASYFADDEGEIANKVKVIEKGKLLMPLGGYISRARAGGNFQGGTANARACSWNRPAIDRMANLNLEPGDSTWEELIAQVEQGIYVETNASWSIDDSRNKFQFGCEWGRLIEDGRLTKIIKNPRYRGVSAEFWRNLRGVGHRDTWRVLGTPFCGKGEPNQVIRVGHASPVCLFDNVEVF